MAVESLEQHSRRLRAREAVRTVRTHWLASLLGLISGLLLGVATSGVPF